MAGYKGEKWAKRAKRWSNKKGVLKDIVLAMLIVGGIALVLLRSFGIFDTKYTKYTVWVTTRDGGTVWAIQEIEVPEGTTIKMSSINDCWIVAERSDCDEVIMSVSSGKILIKDADGKWQEKANIPTDDIKIDGFAKVRD